VPKTSLSHLDSIAPANAAPVETSVLAKPRGRGDGTATRLGSRRIPRYPRGAAAPVLVEVRRAGIVESRHRGHVVQVNAAGQVERAAGDPETLVTLRSAVKPFALVALVESGAADEFRLSAPELAIMAASHAGEDVHVRTLQAVFRRAGISQSLLACGTAGAPLDEQTRARLARDGEDPGSIRHNCSGFHAASLLLSRHAGWSLDDYWRPDHQSQVAVRSAVARAFGRSPKDLQLGGDDCGLQTYAFPLVDVARAFRLLADPHSDPERWGSIATHLARIRDAMMAAPEMVGGTRDMLDTVLMRRKPGRIVAKGGAESLRGIGLLPGEWTRDGAAAGVAVKIEDGDGFARANRGVTIEALSQLGALNEADVRALAHHHHPVSRDPQRRIVAETVAGFELAPISELL
jgi:L-asparaginase II